MPAKKKASAKKKTSAIKSTPKKRSYAMNHPQDAAEVLVDSYEHRVIEMISRPEVGAQRHSSRIIRNPRNTNAILLLGVG